MKGSVNDKRWDVNCLEKLEELVKSLQLMIRRMYAMRQQKFVTSEICSNLRFITLVRFKRENEVNYSEHVFPFPIRSDFLFPTSQISRKTFVFKYHFTNVHSNKFLYIWFDAISFSTEILTVCLHWCLSIEHEKLRIVKEIKSPEKATLIWSKTCYDENMNEF